VGRGIAIALALSLAANVFLGGVVVGRLAAPKPPAAGVAQPLEAAGALSADARARMEKAYRARRPDARAGAFALRAAFTDLRDALEAEEFDAEAASAAFARLRAARQQTQALQEEIFIEGVKDLSAEDRRALAADLAARRRGAFRRMRQRGGAAEDAGIEGQPVD
jgi:uncharacterized membrane protein